VSTPTSISIPKLSADVSGRVIGPDDAEYDKARAVFYGGFDLHPAVVVRVAEGAADLLDAVRAGRAPTSLGQTDRPLLVARGDGGDVAIERLEDALAALLERALEAVPAPELERLVVTLGGTSEDAPGIIAGLRDDGLLV